MKKLKVILGIALACAFALSCLAFTACGDSTFNIDTSKQATDAELKTFVEGATAGAESETDMIAGSYKVVFEMSSKTEETNMKAEISANLDGVININETPSAKISGNFKTSVTATGTTVKSDEKIEMTLLQGKLFLKAESDGVTQKIKIDLSNIGNLFGLSESEVYATADTRKSEQDLTVEGFLQEIKDSLAQYGLTYSPKLYIDGKVMKLELDDKSYFGIAFDDNWNLSAADIVLEAVDLSKAENIPTGIGGNMGLKLTLRSTDPQTVTAPSDAKDYKDYLDFGGGLDGLL